MDRNKPIGLFDSGVGGLTVLRELKKILPNENYIYLADTKNNPYGEKSGEEIIRFTKSNIDFMINKKVKAIVIACNTASAFYIESIKGDYDIPIITVLESAVDRINKHDKNILITATKATIKSKSYEKNILNRFGNINIYNEICSDIVPYIENDNLSDDQIQYIVDKHMSKYRHTNLDLVILGCTHFPIWEEYFKKSISDESVIFDPAILLSKKLYRILESKEWLNIDDKRIDEFYVTKNKDKFVENTYNLFPEIELEYVKEINI